MRTYKIVSMCGSGIATSSHIATSIKNGLENMGLPIEVSACGVKDIVTKIGQFHPDIIVHTMSLESVDTSKLSKIKTMNGLPFLTGVGKDKLLNDMKEYLETLS